MSSTRAIAASAVARGAYVVRLTKAVVLRSRPSVSVRNAEWSHTPASASGCSDCSISAARPPAIMLGKSAWIFQVQLSGPNRPGSPTGAS